MTLQIPPSVLRLLLDYDPETGWLTWRHRDYEDLAHLTSRASCSKFNSQFAGKRALSCTAGSHGYLTGAIFGRQYLAHRVIWAIETDGWPDCIDHINGNRRDNRIANLRSVSKAENAKNK